MNDPAFILEWNMFPDFGESTVCRIVEFDGWRSNRMLARVWPPFRPCEPVRFDTNYGLLEFVPDYPNNTALWPVMSRRMLDVLLSIREFAYHEVPVTLVQDTIPVEVRYDARGRPKPEYSKSDYVGVQLTDHSDAFDRVNSVFKPSQLNPNTRVARIKKLVLSVPPEGLPPLFRLSVYPMYTFVSREAREALESAGIRGPVYDPLSKIF